MDEATWLMSTDPTAMLAYLLGSDWADTSHEWNRHPTATDRKLRLFADACREHFYGSATNGGTESYWEYESRVRDHALPPERDAILWANECSQKGLRAALLRDIFGNPFRPVPVLWKDGRAWLRLDKEMIWCPWLTWNDNTVARLAQSIYEDRAFDRLPILADALEEAGCTHADILAHCRGDFVNAAGERVVGANRHLPHVRGCWVLDLLLGKE